MMWRPHTLWGARTKSLLGTLAVAAAVVVAPALAANTAAAGRTVQDPGHQFTLSVPSTWSVEAPSGNVTLAATAPEPGRGLPDSLDVVVRGVPSGMSPQSCESEAEWVTQHFAHINFSTVSKGPTTVAGLPAYAHEYTWKASNGETRWSRQVCLVQQGKAFVLIGTTAADAAALAGHAGLLAQIVNSLHIASKPGAGSPSSQPSTTR
ncbi:MAG TPA: hypothetical protein VEZ44_14480 [bacterium]|nr:hypothetical protein [bacterium]